MRASKTRDTNKKLAIAMNNRQNSALVALHMTWPANVGSVFL